MKHGTLTVQEWASMIAKLADWRGWLMAQTNKGASEPGAPHLVLIRDGKTVAVWVKAERSALTKAEISSQLVWESVAEVHTWRQVDRTAIEEALS